MEYYLRNINLQNDAERIYELLIRCERTEFMSKRFVFLNKDDCQHWLSRQLSGYFHDFYVIEENSETGDTCICGFIIAYDYRVYDSHCHIYGYIRKGITKEVLSEFLHVLFREYPLRKVFLEVTELDEPLLSVAQKVGFKEEARLLDNKYIDGNYRDLVILSIYVADFLGGK